MKTAFAYWDERIAPVFDTARRVHVVEAESGEIVRETEEVLVDDSGTHGASAGGVGCRHVGVRRGFQAS